ncbi:MAG: P-loop NTPase [Cycloclasticus sp.]
MIDGPRGLKVVPGATGIAEYAHLSGEQKTILLAALDKLQQSFDYLIIDTAAGIGDDVLDFIKASQFSIIIITPEPTSLADSFSLLKVLKRSNYDRTSYVLVNMAMNYENSQSIYKRFESAVKKYIHVDIAYLGYIQVDETMISSVSLQCPAVLLSPESIASECFKKLAHGLEKHIESTPVDSFSDFWRQQDDVQESVPSETPTTAFISGTKTPIKTTPAVPTPLNFKQAADFCLNALSEDNLDAEEVNAFFDSVNEHQPKKEKAVEPTDEIKPSSVGDFYHYLEKNAFPKEEIWEVVSTLEHVYFDKYGESLSSLDAVSLKLFAQFSGSEEELRQVYNQLSARYQRQFDKPLHNVIEQTQALSQSDDFSVTVFDDVLKTLLSVYKQRFNEHYKTQADKDLL